MHAHAACALDQRLYQDGGDFPVGGEQGFEGADLVARFGQGDDVLFLDGAAEHVVHAFIRIADRHGGQRVAMIAAEEGDEFRALLAGAVTEILDGDLHGDFDGDGAGFGEEDAGKIARREGGQAAGEAVGGFMGEAAEHDVGHPGHLGAGSVQKLGPVIAVNGGPPAADAIDQFAAVGEVKPGAFGAGDGHGRREGAHLGVGQPDMFQPLGEPVFRVCHLQRS